MSGVVLRCPNCGTTRGIPGECEACHEAEARYYCTNHTPGRWLDATACPQCGAAFGDPARPTAPAPAPRAGPPAAPASSGRPRTSPAPGVDRRPPPSPAPPAGYGRTREFGDRPHPADVERDPEPADHEAERRVPRWQELLLAVARAGAARRDATRYVDPEPPRRGRGCLLQVVLFAVVAFIALMAAPSLLGTFLLRLLGGY